MGQKAKGVGVNGSAEGVEAALEHAAAVVERHTFRKIVLVFALIAIAALVVNLILNRGNIGIGRRPQGEPSTPEDTDDDQ